MKPSPKRIAFYTLGCKLNYAETATIAQRCEEGGYTPVDFRQEADVYVINTCSVTEHADRDCRKLVRQARRRAPGARVVLMGCYGQLKPHEAQGLLGVDLVLGSNEKFNLVEYLNQFPENGKTAVRVSPLGELDTFHPALALGERTRAFLKVQDGCDYPCTYCSIPLSRGRSRNQSVAETLAAARRMVNQDVKEIVLTGVNLGTFGQDGEESLLDLLQALESLPGIERLRISSIEPNLLTDDIIELVARSPKYVPHFHLPLQSGSNAILRAMRRRYTREVYAQRVVRVKAALPHACIGADVMVGFPGETEAHFEETCQYIEALELSYLHVFSFSPRPGTQAADYPDQVHPEIRKVRSRRLHSLGEEKRLHFHQQALHTVRPVLFETHTDGQLQGYTDNYIRVTVPGSPEWVNTIGVVELLKATSEGMVGCLISGSN